jgi:hypothetical protein
MLRSTVAYAAGSFLLLVMASLASCAASSHSAFHGGPSSDDGGPFSEDGAIPDGMGIVGQGDDGGFSGGPGGSGTGMCQTLKRGCSSGCTDFPTAPILDKSAPANAASLFSGSGGSGGPCISDPQQGTLIPQNWLRPRFAYSGGSGQVYQITLTTMRQANPLVAYTTNTSWTLPKDVWDALRGDSYGDKVDVKICSVASGGGSPACSTSSFTIAPASAGGSMIYWAAIGDWSGDSWLEGFAPGDESVATTLQVGDVQAKLDRDANGNLQSNGAVNCIGCHSAIPDGESVAFVDWWPWPTSVANVKPVGDAGTTGQVPSWLSTQGGLELGISWLGPLSFSKTDWSTEKIAITTYGGGPLDYSSDSNLRRSIPWSGQTYSDQPAALLMWMQLDAPAPTNVFDAGQYQTLEPQRSTLMNAYGTTWGFLARTGDNNGAEFANFSHDGTKVLYVSTNAGKDGRLGRGNADLYTIPFNNKKGGAATPVMGASDPNAAEYYPAFSEDDKFIAFDRATTQGGNGMYYNPYGEVYVIASGGASSPTRLAANDPVSCPVTVNGQATAPTSPGVTNSWPKWSPDVESCPDGSTYYWLVFSSTRSNIPFSNPGANFNPQNGGPKGPTSQLFITGVTVDSTGKITTYPALYLWNQPSTNSLVKSGNAQSNHTPAWETIAIPRHPQPVVN